MKELSGELRRRRRAADLTQVELADRVGISQRSLSLYEAGTILPRVDVLGRLADVLGCTLDELAGREVAA